MEDKLHKLESLGNELCYKGQLYDKVPIRWVVVARTRERMRLYEEAVKNYYGCLDVTDMVPTVNDVRTFFSHVEAEMFKEYLADKYRWSIAITPLNEVFGHHEFNPEKVYPYVGGWRRTYIDVFKNGNYMLDFRVSGCCDWNKAVRSQEQE